MTEESTARRRELGSELRNIRKRQRMSGHALGRRLEWPPSNISRLETGVRPLPVVDVATFLGTCNASAADRKRLLKLAEASDDSYWVRPYFDALTDPLKSLIIQESLAESILNFESTLIPGLQQTEAYMRAAFELDERGRTREQIDVLIKARVDRQKLLDRRVPPHCTYFIHERALRSMLGGRQVMQEQLLHLVLSSNLRHCTIRVVPESNATLNMLDNPFRIMEFADHPAVVYTDTYTAGLFIDDRMAVEAYYSLSTRLQQNALSEGESRQWLAQQANEYDRMEE
jgi:transcriptional regulator with XRE-family HTH domain